MARRLAERGVRLIQLYHRAWDHHGDIEHGHADRPRARSTRPAPRWSRTSKQRGMLDDTLILWGGEFGRTPMGQGTGRDHHILGFSIWMAGGGIKGGIDLRRHRRARLQGRRERRPRPRPARHDAPPLRHRPHPADLQVPGPGRSPDRRRAGAGGEGVAGVSMAGRDSNLGTTRRSAFVTVSRSPGACAASFQFRNADESRIWISPMSSKPPPQSMPTRAISRIAVRGFKPFHTKQEIRLRPLTILAGSNSSGKSSMMQPLLLLKQTLEAPYDPGPLLIRGPNVEFSEVKQMFCQANGTPKNPRLRARAANRGNGIAVGVLGP